MSDKWEVGDLALCLSDDLARHHGRKPPKKGDIGRVLSVTQGRTLVGLILEGFSTPNPLGWAANRFRKIKPDVEPCEEEFMQLLNLSKPRVKVK